MPPGNYFSAELESGNVRRVKVMKVDINIVNGMNTNCGVVWGERGYDSANKQKT